MNRFYWDASALGKRYTAETGSELVNHGFQAARNRGSFLLAIGAGEVVSVLVRKQNSDLLSRKQAGAALALLRADLALGAGLQLENPPLGAIVQSWRFIEQHGVNATDALVLQSALDVAASLSAEGDELVLVSSDLRLIRSAEAEGLATFDPGIGLQFQLDALLAT